MENQDSFVVDNSDESGDSALAADWSEADGDQGTPNSDAVPAGKETARVNLAARRAIEDYQERKRLRQLIGDDLLDY